MPTLNYRGLTWSNKGLAKLKQVKKTVAEVARLNLMATVGAMIKPAIIRLAPSAIEEGLILSRGKSGRGVPYGNRFEKRGGQRPLKIVLATEPIIIKIIGKSVWAGYGRIKVINRKIGFSWKVGKTWRSTEDRGAWHSTWDNLLQMWDEGGAYTVSSRGTTAGPSYSFWMGKGYKLHPEPGYRVMTMDKNIPARNFVKKGYVEKRTAISDKIKEAIKIAVKGI